MKNIFDSNEQRITEKAFSHGLIISVLSILLCIIALCSASYAWFNTDLSSDGNVLESGRFALDITVTDENGELVELKDNNNGTFSCELEKGSTYTVLMKMTNDTTATKGYCDVTINSSDKKQTASISEDSSIGKDPIEFTIEVNVENTVVVFEPKWSIPADPQIFDGEALVVGAANENTGVDESDEASGN